MSNREKALVIGAGFGGLSSALVLALRGFDVSVFDAAEETGGKAGTVTVDGVTLDTGPSLMTLPQVAQHLFELAGERMDERLTLRAVDPAFRYHYADGTALDIYHRRESTIESVRETLGSTAASELDAFLQYTEAIWDASAPHFVFGDAPSFYSILTRDFRALIRLPAIDAMSTMYDAICSRVRSPHLRMLLARYATYNGSDVRQCPGTLNCIAHVELALGGYGVEGGMQSVARALTELCIEKGVTFHLNTRVASLEMQRKNVVALHTEGGQRYPANVIVSNAEAQHLFADLLPKRPWRRRKAPAPSMSAYNLIYRATGTANRAPHSVFFPENYLDEFAAIFDRKTIPPDPTVYVCDQAMSHNIPEWSDGYPLFAMVNAPAVGRNTQDMDAWHRVRSAMTDRLQNAGLLKASDAIVWERQPTDLARRFPGSAGSIYGAASNAIFSAFRRPANRVNGVKGLYVATGSAHPGGGVPLCLLSGLAAARAAVEDARGQDDHLLVNATGISPSMSL